MIIQKAGLQPKVFFPPNRLVFGARLIKLRTLLIKPRVLGTKLNSYPDSNKRHSFLTLKGQTDIVMTKFRERSQPQVHVILGFVHAIGEVRNHPWVVRILGEDVDIGGICYYLRDRQKFKMKN